MRAEVEQAVETLQQGRPDELCTPEQSLLRSERREQLQQAVLNLPPP